MEKGEIAQNEQFRLFSTTFSMQSATFHLSSAALNLGQSQNGVLGNGLTWDEGMHEGVVSRKQKCI